MSSFTPALDQLRVYTATLRHLDGVIDLLGWDEETYLPAGAREERGEQLATLESLRHARLVAPELGALLDDVRAGELDPATARSLALLHRRRARALALPESLVRAFAGARSRSLAAWEDARRTRRFADWAPALRSLLELVRERGRALAGGGDPYDALLDEYDPGMTRAMVGPLLTDLRDRLVPLARRVARPDAPRPSWLIGHVYADSLQETLCREMLAAIGFDMARGRLDRSTHPFSLSTGFDDVRLTIRAFEHDPLPAVFGALHEGGHGLYEQGFDPAHRGTPLAAAPGMAIHESQSRLWENLVGRSRPFWTRWLPRMRELFPGPLATVELEPFLAELRCVRPGLIRVDADEVTYNLHIVLRYHLETALLAGDLDVGDLPAAFNAASAELLGLTPPDDLRGCMQDVHWAIGALGYFPSYTLGNLYAAQLHEAFTGAHPNWDDTLAHGDAGPLLAWLRAHVHRVGHLREGDAIVAAATGQPLSAEPFLRHLERTYA
jgi:carboxypeptidase Taq